MTNPYVRKISAARFDPFQGQRPALGQIDIELTERCNNRCIHCYINRNEHDTTVMAREMTTEFLLDILKQAANLGCLTVRFTGGEPLLRSDFVQLYLAARRLGMAVIIFTNARLITDEIASLFSKIPPGHPVEISVYGMRPASYDSIAGVRGAFEEFRKGLDRLIENEVLFVVKQALLPQNRNEMAEFEAWAADLPVARGKPAFSMNFDLRARRDDPAKSRRIMALRLTPKESLAINITHPDFLSEMQEFCSKYIGPPGDRLFACGAGHGVAVDAYGMAQMCLLLRHPKTVVDLHEIPLRTVVTEIFPRLRIERTYNPNYLDRCGLCFLKGLCEQCPAKAWMEHGTLDTPVEYLCAVAHAQARYLGLLGSEENAWEVECWEERLGKFLSIDPDRKNSVLSTHRAE